MNANRTNESIQLKMKEREKVIKTKMQRRLMHRRSVAQQICTLKVSWVPLQQDDHKVPTSELSASAIFRRSSKQRDECLNPMRAGEILGYNSSSATKVWILSTFVLLDYLLLF